MEVGIALVGGIIIGLVIEWVIDWQYWRRGIASFYANESRLRSALAEAEDKLQAASAAAQQSKNDLSALRAQLQAAKVREAELQRKLDAASIEIDKLKQRLEATAVETRAEVITLDKRDDLERIDGIRPVYEQRLFDAGIATYAQLSVTSPDDLQGIIQPAAWQHVDFERWIEEARQFAEVAVMDQLPYRLEEIRGIGPTYVRRLNASGITTLEQLAQLNEEQLAEIIEPAAWQNVDFAGWIRQAKAFAALVAGDRPPLPLEKIKGIGPVSATRLELAGIRTFEELAETSEIQLQEIIGKNTDVYRDWIAQAKELSAAVPAAVSDSQEA